jgi:hypothetical protein
MDGMSAIGIVLLTFLISLIALIQAYRMIPIGMAWSKIIVSPIPANTQKIGPDA